MTLSNTRIVNASGLRLRDTPFLSGAVLSVVRRGTAVEITETSRDGLWRRVTVKGKTGWMASKYLTADDHPTAPVAASEEFPWMPIALGEVGVHEAPGSDNNARVLEYLRSTELERSLATQDSTPWCSAFVNWCVEKSGYAGTNSAAARSWLGWGKAIVRPRRGCVAVFTRGNLGGHVAFFMEAYEAGVHVLGGNQGDSVKVASYGVERLLGYRVPG